MYQMHQSVYYMTLHTPTNRVISTPQCHNSYTLPFVIDSNTSQLLLLMIIMIMLFVALATN